jgi:hypothetical protein
MIDRGLNKVVYIANNRKNNRRKNEWDEFFYVNNDQNK